jgi:hypothetical protein
MIPPGSIEIGQSSKRGLTHREVDVLFGTAHGIELDVENGLEYWWYGQRAVAFTTVKKTVSFWDK